MEKYLLYFLVLTCTLAIQDIMHFGAIPNEDSLKAQVANAKAINLAIEKARDKESTGDERIVVVPTKKFYTMPIAI